MKSFVGDKNDQLGLVAFVTFGVMLGTWIAHKKQSNHGEIFCFQPFSSYFALTFLLSGGASLFVEAARVCLINPSRIHLWILILSALTIMVIQLLMSANENRHAQKKIKRDID